MHNLQIKNNDPCTWIKSVLGTLAKAEMSMEQGTSNKEGLSGKENMNSYH